MAATRNRGKGRTSKRRKSGSASTEQALRESETRLAHVLASSPVVLFTLEQRGDGLAPTWSSDSIERVMGHTVEEALEPGWWLAHLHPDDAQRSQAAAAAARAGQRVVHEYRFRQKDGSYRWVREELRPLPASEPGRPLSVIGAWLDVTEQKRAQEELGRREAYFRTLIEHATDTVVVLAVDGCVEYASPSIERATGYAPEALQGRNAFDLIHPDDLPRVREAFLAALGAMDQVVRAEYRVRHADGSWRHAESVGRVLPSESGAPRLVINSRDVTDARLLSQQLRQAQKLEAVGQLTAGIVHDFNNTLSVILSTAELLAGGLPAELAEAREDIEHVKRAAQSGAAMVHKLLAFSRQAELTIASVDLGPVLRDVGAMLERIIPRDVAVQLVVEEPLPPARADAVAVQQIVLNLATNARDAMPGGGALTIHAGGVHLDEARCRLRPGLEPGEYVALSVTDTGTGMDEATLAKIFDPFFTTKPPGKGTGLGMPMVFGLVKQHGGCLDVESRVGVGTTVRVHLPVAREAPTAGAPVKPASLAGAETLLLVEDEAALRRTGRRVLESFGYRVLVARDGEEGLQLFDAHADELALVLSDVEMPKLGGIGLYREIRRRRPDLPFVFATGFNAAQLESPEGFGPEVSFLAKPWTMEEIGRTVRAALDGRRERLPH